ncbi:MAG: cell division protein ZapB [Treponema sp.]|nr:cell division protein ZapB [Treponema sp.]
MVSLEQVQLLESKVARAIEYVKRVTDQNSALTAERAGLLSKLEANQKRLDELESLVMRFKHDQGRIEDGIMAALDRLSQFEEAFEKSLKDDKASPEKKAKHEKPHSSGAAKKPAEGSHVNSKEYFEITEAEKSEGRKDDDSSDDGELDIF